METVNSLPHSQAPAPHHILSQINPVNASYQTSIPSPKPCQMFGNMVSSHGEELLALTPSWRPTSCRVYDTSYLIHSKLPSNKDSNSKY